VNYSRTDGDKLSELHDIADREFRHARHNSRRRIFGRVSVAERSQARRERDIARGYSVNVKQVVLAFAIEFAIIGLILNSQYFIGIHSLTEAQQQIISNSNFQIVLATIMNFPVALAMVELARVPLALAVRTQNSWNIKLAAAVGVLFAITVTSFSLSTIAYQTFDPRLVEAQERNNALQDFKAQKEILVNEISLADRDLEQKIKERDNAGKNISNLQSQITAISTTKGESCTTTTDAAGLTTKKCVPSNVANRAQLQTLQSQLSAEQKNRDEKNAAVIQAEEKRAKYDPRKIDEKITKADADYRSTINHSQLHSYTSMIKFKAPKDVTEAEVKNLEAYLIFIPSIAAAFASTLIAITAVRRIKLPRVEPSVTMPDEALAFLLGPLVQTLEQEARNMIRGTNSDSTQTQPKAGPSIKTVKG
jgi:hypothetical protein